ncbi:response regulator transcription factor [Marinitoga aeolica]|uniref:Response regulator transcription factor n=1 Tax=Marinitoga aeolica TaxID=2809031 RepID=A0ABY8PS97_9BACT|nr:response regulator transcription factor [Marinitoga aeolica]WGS65506.1 response regulator transcription factor [Marinitoga aeolica]
MKNILIIEDDRAIVRVLELELLHEGYTFDVAFDGKKGLEMFEENNYEIILLDLMLPKINGLEICRKIRLISDIPIIMLTAKRDIMDKVIGLDMGADDYVTKPFEMEELLARIRAAIRRRRNMGKKDLEIKIGDLTINFIKRQVIKKGEIIELTKKEYELLEYLVKNKGRVLTREQIIEKIWGYDFFGEPNILDVYIRYLRKKIDYPYGTKLIKTIRGVGYKIEE